MGIGTTIPDSELEVSAAATTTIKVTESTNNVENVLYAGSTQGQVGTVTKSSFRNNNK